MPRNSLKTLMEMFPWFFDKSETSNFYKSQDITNKRFQELYNDLFKTYESFHLNKRLLIWKEQDVPYVYQINFVANFPNLKKVSIFKDDNLVSERVFDDEGTSSFDYIYSYDTRNELLFNPIEGVNEVNVHYQDLLDKLLFWRTDVDDSHFDVNLRADFTGMKVATPYDEYYVHVKSVTLYKNEEVIYTNSYEDIEEVSLVEYSYRNTISSTGVDEEDENEDLVHDEFNIEIELWNGEETLIKYLPQVEPSYITASQFLIEVETYDEYIIQKGFPENDYTYLEYRNGLKEGASENKIIPSPYDHDYSLDRFGKITNIPRKNYIKIDTLSEYYTSEPPFNNRATEDDYHYMKRMIEYHLRLHDTPAPVLEIWKLYGINAVMLNRERYLLKWFDILRHPHHKEIRIDECTDTEYETLVVDDWEPEPWEHKDTWEDGSSLLGEYFYATASTVRPVKKQPVSFDFKVLNSLAEDITDNYTVTIMLNSESVETDYPTSQRWRCDPDLLDEFEDNIFTFIGKDGKGNIIGTVEIIIQVRGCDDADFYVCSTGNDSNDGSSSAPFRTLQKALNSVNGNLNLIAVYGSITINAPCIVKENCAVIGCETAEITNTGNPRFFHVAQGKELTVCDINFIKGEFSAPIETQIFTNDNLVNETLTAILETKDYSVSIDDLVPDKFIKNLTFNQTTGVLSWVEVGKSDLTKLSDFNGLVKDLNLSDEDGLTFTEYSTSDADASALNLPFVPVSILGNAVFYIEDDETVLEDDNVILVKEYGSEIYDMVYHDMDEYEIQHISSVSQISLTQVSGDDYELVIQPVVLNPVEGQSIVFELNTGETTNATFEENADYAISVRRNKSKTVRIVFKRFVSDGIAYLGCEKLINIVWS